MNLEDKVKEVWEKSGRNRNVLFHYLLSNDVSPDEYAMWVDEWPEETFEGNLGDSFISKWLLEEEAELSKIVAPAGGTLAAKARNFFASDIPSIPVPSIPVPTWTDEEIASAIAQTNAANSCPEGHCEINEEQYLSEVEQMLKEDVNGEIPKLVNERIISEAINLYEEIQPITDEWSALKDIWENEIEKPEEQLAKAQMKEVGIAIIESMEKIENSQKHKGLRFNTGKTRYDLVHPWAHEQMAKVLTKGAEKYAERNWERGMAWSNVLASLERHLQAIKKGEDFDPETGLLHAAHIACNAHFLTAYYKIYPQGDDRPHRYLSPLKIGLDIDDVLADFVGKWRERYPNNEVNFWNFDKDMKEKFAEVAQDKEFWMTMKPKIKPEDLPFEPTCYITSRMIPNDWTEEWLQLNGFPAVPVHTIGFNESKVDVAKESGIEIFVDDRYENFVELNNAGIATFLMDAKHNQRYDVGFKRIHSLKDLM
jgi:5'(3')-deoxyribonucleotidase